MPPWRPAADPSNVDDAVLGSRYAEGIDPDRRMPFTPPPLVSDPLRLAALSEIRILDTPAEPGFDSIVQLTCQICEVPVALVSLVAEDRQWFKARVNFPSCETDLSRSVCAHALASPDDLLIIPDLAADPRTRANPLVTGDPFIRFYAGAPLVTSDGQVLGTLCAIDKAPRPAGLSEAQAEGLKALAAQVMSQLALHEAIRARDTLRAEDQKTLRIREALMQTQNRINTAEGDLDRVLATVLDGAMAAVPEAEGGTVALIDGAELAYSAVRGTLAGEAGLRLGLHNTFTGHCVTTRTARRLVDATVEPHACGDLLARLRLRSAVAAPILRGETVLGVLKLQCSRPDAFTDRDLEIVGLFAGAATAGFAEAAVRAAVAPRTFIGAACSIVSARAFSSARWSETRRAECWIGGTWRSIRPGAFFSTSIRNRRSAAPSAP